jgi:hypothetical protein
MEFQANPMFYGGSQLAFSMWSPHHGGLGGPYHGRKLEGYFGRNMLRLGGKLDDQFV